MTGLDILIPISGTDEDIELLTYGSGLAALTSGTATALLVQPDPVETLSMAGDPGFAMFSPSVIDGLRRGQGEMADAARTRASAAGHIEMEQITGSPGAVLPRRASLADLVVVSCPCARNQGLLAGVCETLLMDARVPVFVARGAVDKLAGVALIAWDGGPESGRALRRSLPLLAKASRVVVAQVTKPLSARMARFAEPERAVTFLARNGITAEVTVLPEADHEAEAILFHAKAIKAGLLVAGAYGHSRLQEFVFGGATRVFLGATDSPALFLVH